MSNIFKVPQPEEDIDLGPGLTAAQHAFIQKMIDDKVNKALEAMLMGLVQIKEALDQHVEEMRAKADRLNHQVELVGKREIHVFKDVDKIVEGAKLFCEEVNALKNRDRREIPWAFCCNGAPSACDCANPKHGTTYSHE